MEYSSNPREFEPMPQEFSIPAEFPEQSKKKTTPKKRSSAKALAMLAISGIVTLHLGFGYLFPDLRFSNLTPEQQEQIIAEQEKNPQPAPRPVDTTPVTPTLPQSNPNVELSLFADGFIQAANAFENGGYVTAAQTLAMTFAQNYNAGGGVYLTNSFLKVASDSVSILEKNNVWSGSDVIIACYHDMYYTEGKTGMESNPSVALTMMRRSDSGETQLLTVSFGDYTLGDQLVMAEASYITGVFDAEGSSDAVQMYCFGLFPEYAGENLDPTTYSLYTNRVISGPMYRGHFCGEVLSRHWGIGYDETLGAFNAMTVSPENDCNVWSIYELNEEGILDVDQVEYMDLRGYDTSAMTRREIEDLALLDPNVRYYRTSDGDYDFLYIKSTAAPELQYHYRWCFTLEELESEMFPLYGIMNRYLILSKAGQ